MALELRGQLDQLQPRSAASNPFVRQGHWQPPGHRPRPPRTSRGRANAEWRCGSAPPGPRALTPAACSPRCDGAHHEVVRGPAAPARRPRPRPPPSGRNPLSRLRFRRRDAAPSPMLSNPGPRLALDADTTARRHQPGRQHLATATPSSPTSRRRATGSTGSGDTLGMSFSAVSGSLRPLPVTVHTTVEPRGTQPSSTDLSRPAMLAADAGSTKTPSALGHQVVGRQDLLVGGGQEATLGLLLRLDGRGPRRGCADADRGGDGFGVADRCAEHQRRGAGGLGAQHAGQLVDHALAVVLGVALPVRGDVARRCRPEGHARPARCPAHRRSRTPPSSAPRCEPG